MCLIALAWQVAGQPLLLLGNRDEFHRRPTRQAQFWVNEGWPDLLAGQDQEAGGTWLGITRSGRFAALTNIRSPGLRTGLRSRGELVTGFLTSSASPEAYLSELRSDCGAFGGFNLLVGNTAELWHLNSAEAGPSPLSPGYYGLSNASLNTPWPKLLTLRTRLQETAKSEANTLLELLADPNTYPDSELPQTGVSQEWERALSAAFIVGEDYGTRASTLVRITAQGCVHFHERRFGPKGKALGESRFEFELQP